MSNSNETKKNSAMPGTRYLTRREIAAKFGLSERYLERLAAEENGPPIVKIGRAVRYPEDLAEKWASALIVHGRQDVAA